MWVDDSGYLHLKIANNAGTWSSAEIYTTASPCWNCFKLIANAGIRRISFGEFYREERIRETAQQIGIDLHDLRAAKQAEA